MTYEQAITTAQEHATTQNVNTCVFIRLDGEWDWSTYFQYAMNPQAHPFSLGWTSEATNERNAARRETAQLWLQRQQESVGA